MIRVDYSQFFDRDAVIKAIDRAERSKLSKAGSFVRRRVRSSIRKRKKVSAPGQPPSSHDGMYRKSILFGYDQDTGSVVIGPSARFGNSEVPTLLEFGGTVTGTRLVPVESGGGRDDGGRFIARTTRLKRVKGTFTYAARPHMGPALEAEAPNFPNLFRNAVTR